MLTQPNSEECVRVRSTEHDIHVIAIVNILNGTTHRRLANYHGAYQDARTSTRASTLPDRTREHVTYSSCIRAASLYPFVPAPGRRTTLRKRTRERKRREAVGTLLGKWKRKRREAVRSAQLLLAWA